MKKSFFKKISNKFSYHIKKLQEKPIYFFYKIKSRLRYRSDIKKINLCSGPVLLPDYCNVDIHFGADLVLDLEKQLLPFCNNSIDIVVCISAINYFTRKRGEKIIKDIHRILKVGGIARFATQDLKSIAKKYIDNDKDFFFQKLPNGNERFKGETMCDKFNSWFSGYQITQDKKVRYFYDYETLSLLFKKNNFNTVERKKYLESQIPDIEKIDNRPDQMFFLEAIK